MFLHKRIYRKLFHLPATFLIDFVADDEYLGVVLVIILDLLDPVGFDVLGCEERIT